VMRSWSIVAMGRTRAERRLFFSLARAQAELARLSPEAWKEMGGDEVQAIATRFGLQVEEVVEMQARLGGRDTSLESPMGEDGDRTFGDLLAGGDVPADEALRGEELRAALQAEVDGALRRLDPRERDIVRRRLLVDGSGETMAAIASEYGVSRERVRQLELRGLEKLRAHLRGIAMALDYPGARDAKPLYVRALVKGSRRDDPAARRS
jgi:RNA polymerase sigma-32 factor